MTLALDLAALRFDERGLLPVVVQDETSGGVLMLAWADAEALRRTLSSGEAWFWSRSRERLWKKGETSGNVLAVVAALADCDGDAVLLRVRPAGPTCHRGTRSCFEPNPAALELGWLAEVIASRRGADPAVSWSARLLADPALAARKVGEEAVETMVAALGGEGNERLAAEAADLVYHLLALLAGQGVELADLASALSARRQPATVANGERIAGGEGPTDAGGDAAARHQTVTGETPVDGQQDARRDGLQDGERDGQRDDDRREKRT